MSTAPCARPGLVDLHHVPHAAPASDVLAYGAVAQESNIAATSTTMVAIEPTTQKIMMISTAVAVR